MKTAEEWAAELEVPFERYISPDEVRAIQADALRSVGRALDPLIAKHLAKADGEVVGSGDWAWPAGRAEGLKEAMQLIARALAECEVP